MMHGFRNQRRLALCAESLAPRGENATAARAMVPQEVVDPGIGKPLAHRQAATIANGQTILLALPDDTYRETLSSYLRQQGFTVSEVGTAQAAIALLVAGETFHAIVTPDDLPDLSGLELLARFRDLGVRTPIAFLADIPSETLEEVALGCGAAEFLCRTRRPSIIAKRLRLLAAGTKRHTDHKLCPAQDLRIGNLALKSDFHRALWHGEEVPLTVTEVRIVRLLACQTGVALSYREIYDVVHGAGFSAGEGPDGYRINVRSLIRKIRKRFRAIDSNFDQIENCQGFGYRWRSNES